MHQYIYAATARQELVDIRDERLAALTERHRIALTPGAAAEWRNPEKEIQLGRAAGMVLEMVQGWPGRAHLRLANNVLRVGGRVFFYWPREEAIECIDRERLSSYRRLWLVVHLVYAYSTAKQRLKAAISKRLPPAVRERLRPYYHWFRDLPRRLAGPQPVSARLDPKKAEAAAAAACLQELAELSSKARPIQMSLGFAPSAGARLPGVGVYLRTDFWARIMSGGSYGHTCYVAKELAASTERFVAFMASRYTMLDDMGVRQVPLSPPGERGDEYTILSGSTHYHRHLVNRLHRTQPRYIYERICLGNYAGARLSQELRIPYIVEYNGSEISMLRSFSGCGYNHEDVYLAAEAAAFRQATVVSVISEAVAEDVMKRDIDASKILVNPNGVDVEAYTPPSPAARQALRRELGFGPDHRVICFTGTFGGWHGVDVLAMALPKVCAAVPSARFLLIGDGSYKHLVDETIRKNRLESRVKSVGRVPQMEGARLLGAADIYVSPHASHMVDSRFFGSPTKIFEYMALGGGIVASDLEQIGKVLAPGLQARELPRGAVSVGQERAILCVPGDLDGFVAGVIYAALFPEVAAALGRNARAAAIAEYSWRRHVERLWQFVHERGL